MNIPLQDYFNGPLGLAVAFLVALVPLLIVHELGHFLMAKKVGVWAHEFGIGIPPRIVRLFRWGETEFTLNWIPFGAFVLLEGEQYQEAKKQMESQDTPPTPEEKAKALAREQEAHRHSLDVKSAGQRFLIYASGPMMNFITAWVLAIVIFLTGIPVYQTVIDSVNPNSPAMEAGIQSGDIIRQINGEEITDGNLISERIAEHLGEPVTLGLERNGSQVDVTLTPRVNPPEGEGAMGVVLTMKPVLGQLDRSSVPEALQKGTAYFASVTEMTVKIPFYLIGGLLPLETARPVGVIGISRMASQTIQDSLANNALYPYLNLLVVVSVALAVFNFLPIPALDGGRILFVLIEKIRGRRLAPATEARINQTAMLVLLGIFVIVTLMDIFVPIQLP